MPEAHLWALYREKRGGFNTALRIEEEIGRLRFAYTKVNSKESNQPDIEDFLPYSFERREATLEEAMEHL